jgi:C-terminal domain 7 of the ABC-three component (ABC-3C) systems
LEAKDGDHICLEVFDDVGVEKKDGTKVAEQSKSNLTTNPLTDRSLGFWKNLRNWIDGAASGSLDPAITSFALFVANPKAGPIAQSFHDASSLEAALKAIDEAKCALKWDAGKPGGAAAALLPHLQVVFAADPDLVAKILCRFSLVQSTGSDPLDELRPLMLGKLVSDDACEDVIKWAHGWAKERIDRLIGQNQPARIAQREFHDALLNYVRKHDRDDILRSVAGKPTDDEVKSELAVRIYVRQAQLITLDETDVLAAVNDFLMASNDRTTWAEEGHISKAGVEAFGVELSRTWKNKKEKVARAYSEKNDIDRGQLVYYDCMDHTAKLEGLETPNHFTRGSFHALAEDWEIGWHPNYAVELTRMEGARTKE